MVKYLSFMLLSITTVVQSSPEYAEECPRIKLERLLATVINYSQCDSCKPPTLPTVVYEQCSALLTNGLSKQLALTITDEFIQEAHIHAHNCNLFAIEKRGLKNVITHVPGSIPLFIQQYGLDKAPWNIHITFLQTIRQFIQTIDTGAQE